MAHEEIFMNIQHPDPGNTRALRDALGHFGTGVTVITTRDERGGLYGITVNSFASVSLDPPLVLWSQAKGAPSNPAFQRCEHFAVNVLTADQELLSRHFARPQADKFGEVEFDLDEHGLPIIRSSAATFICRNDFRLPGGDHVIFLATVLRFAYEDEAAPLLFWRGRFLQTSPAPCA